ncbi:MAG: hypothetical protein MUF15_17595 [Acidobacteria bacterium]|nr:hypothetical protein [Acidobacteriota bacterium]
MLPEEITNFLNKIDVRENGQVKHIDFSSLKKYEARKKFADFLRCLEVREILQKILDKLASLEKTDYIQEIKNILDSMNQNNECPYNKLKKLNHIINHEYNRDNTIYELYEGLKFIFYCFPNINNNKQDIMKKMQDGIAFLQEKLDEAGNKRLEERFPYTPQNREAIIEFSRSIKKKKDNKELFFKSSGLIIPPSFDLMAILNLFQQEE